MAPYHNYVFKLGLIDALELFAGIIIFADSQAEDKIRCKNNYPVFLQATFFLTSLTYVVCLVHSHIRPV